jgi:hypothetical protein
MTEKGIGSALIVAYRRADNLTTLIHLLLAEGISRIYISVDQAPEFDSSATQDVKKVIEAALSLRASQDIDLKIFVHSENVGCAVGVLSACDWFYKNESFGIILEDDCIPTTEFFQYIADSQIIIEEHPNVWLACGTQFAPSVLTNDSWVLSSYALIWGWATTSQKWAIMRENLRYLGTHHYLEKVRLIDRVYWAAGSRRAQKGLVDVWDTILLHRMQVKNAMAILPRESLISNIGVDLVATHTVKPSPFLSLQTGDYLTSQKLPGYSIAHDHWIRNKFYKISFRHLITTRLTQIFDLFLHRNTSKKIFLTKWDAGQKGKYL